MEEKQYEHKELYMPSGLKMKKEIFQGFTKEEMIPTIIVALIFCIVDSVLFLVGVRNISVLFFIPVLGTTIVAFMQIKGEINLSPVDVIKLELAFAKDQRYYPYVAKNEWERE